MKQSTSIARLVTWRAIGFFLGACITALLVWGCTPPPQQQTPTEQAQTMPNPLPPSPEPYIPAGVLQDYSTWDEPDAKDALKVKKP